MKRAQITAFMLLGIVMIGMFSFALYVKRYVSNAQLQKRADEIFSEVMHNTPVNFYVTECLDEALTEGLYLAGMQGGFIFPYQEETIFGNSWYSKSFHDNSFIEYNGFNVTYLIQRHKINSNYNDVPYYPCEGNARSSDNFCFFDYFGVNSNNFRFGSSPYFLPYYTLNKATGMYSLEEQLESYISYHVRQCVNFSAISRGIGYDIKEGNISAIVSFGSDDVSANLRFPLVISFPNVQPITKMYNFYAKEYVRMKVIYDKILEKLIDKEHDYQNLEQTNLSFNISKKFTELNGIGGITLNLINDWIDYPELTHHNDIFILNDNFSKLGENNFYVFQFARQNRIPVLDYINNHNQRPIESPGGSGIEYDITIPYGYEIVIEPTAHDPDEDEIFFNYSGWMETVNETWNATKFTLYQGTDKNCTWHPENCVDVIPGKPEEWTSNYGWKDGWEVKYTTSMKDIGAHNLTVSVMDFDGKPCLTDWQTVRILVVDHPVADPGNSNNDYGDIGRFNASIEDIYWLDASASIGYFCWPWTYKWEDDSEEPALLYEGQNEIVGLPGQFFDPLSFDIRNMTGAFDNYTSYESEYKKEHKINLTVIANPICSAYGTVDTAEIKINVSLCLPHRSNSAPYPYHNLTDNLGFTDYSGVTNDPFQGNHVCCADGEQWGNYTIGNECYRYTSWRCKPEAGTEYYPATLTVNDTRIVQAVLFDANVSLKQEDIEFGSEDESHNSSNDIYKRIFSQNCSGYRGNACSGKFSDTWVVAVECNDLEDAGQTERCQGPTNNQLCEQKNNIYSCYNYISSKSFEKTYLELEEADGICNKHWKVSKYESGGYNNLAGRYLCQAGCGNGDCREPINCINIDSYDYKIPIVDTPWYPSTSPSGLPATDIIYGYTGINCMASTKINTKVPPPTAASVRTWCDGECFSYANTSISSSPALSYNDGNDTCTARDYSPAQLSASFDKNDTINFTAVDIDTTSTWCLACYNSEINQKTEWMKSGEIGVGEYANKGIFGCCGDDSYEYADKYRKNYGLLPTGSSNHYCCSEEPDCINLGGECKTEGSCYNIGSRPAYCNSSYWEDPDNYESYCTAAGCGFEWIVDRCCGDDANEDWLGTNRSIACDNTVKKTCTTSDKCNAITLAGTRYYCNGTEWKITVKDTGGSCGSGGICTTAGCCGETGSNDIISYDGNNIHYCGCNHTYRGWGCEEVIWPESNAGGSFSQEGICANDTASGFICDAVNPVSSYSAQYYTECSPGYDTYFCDNTIDNGGFSTEGICLDEDCCTDYAVDANGYGGPDFCGSADTICNPYYGYTGINNYCDDVSDGTWDTDQECDDTEGKDCITCDGKIDNSGNCEAVCNANLNCDELPPETSTGKCDLIGENYFEDFCNLGCGLEEYAVLCRGQGFDESCEANDDCNNEEPNSYKCDDGTNIGFCETDCSYNFLMGDGLCDTENCGADVLCNNETAGDPLPFDDETGISPGWCLDDCSLCTEAYVFVGDDPPVLDHCGCVFYEDDSKLCDSNRNEEINGVCLDGICEILES